MVSKKNPSKIPLFGTIEEEADFWDTHDTTDFESEFRPVQVRFAKRLSKGITVRFDMAAAEELQTRARALGMRPSTLVRLWVLERMQQQARKAK